MDKNTETEGNIFDDEGMIDLDEGVTFTDGGSGAPADEDADDIVDLKDDEEADEPPKKAEAKPEADDEEDDDIDDGFDDDDDEEDDDSHDLNGSEIAILRQEIAAKDHAHAVEMAKVHKESAEMMQASLKVKRDVLIKQLKSAKEDGDTDSEVDLQQELGNLDNIENTLKSVISESGEKMKAAPPAPTIQTAQTQTNDVSLAPGNSYAEAWIEKNKSWWSDPRQVGARALVKSLDQELSSQGLDPKSPKYYSELTKHVARAYPKTKAVNLNGKPPATGKRKRGGNGKRSPVTGGQTNGAAPNTNKNQVKIGAETKAILRKIGLDPTDTKILKRQAAIKAGYDPDNL